MTTALATIRESLIQTGEYNGVKARFEDAFIVHEVFEDGTYNMLNVQTDDIVLDIGGYIGLFAVWVQRQGAKVVSVEPFLPSVKLLRENSNGLVLYGAALRNVLTSTIPFWVKPTRAFSASIVNRGESTRAHVTNVPVLDFDDILAQVQPTILKIDAEGSEYNLLTPKLPNLDSVKHLAVELHVDAPEWVIGAQNVCQLLDDAGWRRLGRKSVPSKVTGWPTLMFWERA